MVAVRSAGSQPDYAPAAAAGRMPRPNPGPGTPDPPPYSPSPLMNTGTGSGSPEETPARQLPHLAGGDTGQLGDRIPVTPQPRKPPDQRSVFGRIWSLWARRMLQIIGFLRAETNIVSSLPSDIDEKDDAMPELWKVMRADPDLFGLVVGMPPALRPPSVEDSRYVSQRIYK